MLSSASDLQPATAALLQRVNEEYSVWKDTGHITNPSLMVIANVSEHIHSPGNSPCYTGTVSRSDF